MKKYLRAGVAAIAVMFLFSIFAVSETKAQGILNEILKRMDAHQKSLTSLKANVVMDKYNPQIDTHDASEGVTQYVAVKGRDALVRIEWMKPEQSFLVVADGKYILYKPRIKQAYTGSTKNSKGNSSAGGALAFMNMSKEQLRANYTVKYLGQETLSTGVQTWHLELTPKTAQNYKLAELWVDSDGMPVQAKVVENNNDVTTVLLSNLSKNQTINGSVFKLSLPKDTTITKT